MTHKRYDIAIVGSGMVGAALACALSRLPLKIVVIDAIQPELDWPIEGFDLRVSAITRASENLFRAVDAWDAMQRRRVHAYNDMHVWDAEGDGSIHFDCAEIGEPNLGYIIENRVIQGALTEVMLQADNIDYLAPCKLTSLQADEQHAELHTDDAQVIQCKLIVGADGARSWVRDQAGIETIGWPYGQKGVVCTVKTEHSHQDTCWQRFLPTGPLAFLPMGGKHSSIVWSNTDDEADALMALDDETFMQRMSEALGESLLGNVIETSQRAAFPLRLQHSKDYVKSRVALIGDAAHAIHPLAGQGVNLGLKDVAELYSLIEDTLKKGRDIGRFNTLRKYERARKADNLLMMFSMDGFKHLFSNDNKLLSITRNLGLSLTDKTTPLKNRFILHAMGIEGDVAPLMREPL